MTFWKFCEKIEDFVGFEATIANIDTARSCWSQNKTVGEAVSEIEKCHHQYEEHIARRLALHLTRVPK